MEKLRAKHTASRPAAGSPLKKYLAPLIFLLCLMMGGGIAFSMALLGSNLRRFSREEINMIALVPPKEIRAGLKESEALQTGVTGVGEATASQPGSSETGAVLPADGGSAGSGNSEDSGSLAASGGVTTPKRAGTVSYVAGATSYTAGRSGEYRGSIQVSDDIEAWSSETHVNLFQNNYDGTVKSSNGEKVIAPGTSNFYEFTVKNNGDIPLDYFVSLEVDTYLGEGGTYETLPLEWRLLSGDGTAVSDWREYNERTEVLTESTLAVRNQDSYRIEWRWIFERGEDMDEADTGMGNIAVDQSLGVSAAIYLYAEQSADWDGEQGAEEGGWIDSLVELVGAPNTGDASHIVLYILLMAISLCALLILLVIIRHRKNDEDA